MHDQRGEDKLDELHMIGERVKLLDKQDIESCGFNLFDQNTYEYFYNLHKIVIYQKINKPTLLLILKDNVRKFEGHCKNISELKFILNRIQ